jgi:hypothetical protein
MFRSTHGAGQAASSNIRWSYGNLTIPRHLRDLAITEYGVADLRDRNDETCIRRLVAIAAAPFQEGLLAQAKRAGKVALDARLAPDATPNVPEALSERLARARSSGLLPDYPQGSDFTPLEQHLLRALGWMRGAAARRGGAVRLFASALLQRPMHAGHAGQALERMGLDAPRGLRQRLLARALCLALEQTARREKGPAQ